MNSHAKKNLQIWHLALLAVIPLLFVLFRMVSEEYDPVRTWVENLVLIGGSIFSIYSFIFLIVTGKSENALPNLIKLYRHSLSRLPFLIVSNLLLTLIFLLFLHQFAFFRRVEFLSPIDVELYLDNDTNEPERLAFVRARTPAYLRLSVGEHMVAAKDLEKHQLVAGQLVKVPWVFKEPAMVNVWIEPDEDPYEQVY